MEEVRFIFWTAIKTLSLVFLGFLAAEAAGLRACCAARLRAWGAAAEGPAAPGKAEGHP